MESGQVSTAFEREHCYRNFTISIHREDSHDKKSERHVLPFGIRPMTFGLPHSEKKGYQYWMPVLLIWWNMSIGHSGRVPKLLFFVAKLVLRLLDTYAVKSDPLARFTQ